MLVIINKQSQLREVAREILRMKPKVIALEGPMGAGKTALTKEMAKLLGIKDEIVSPTFVLHRPYKGLDHIDCWRMENGGELEQLGFEKMLNLRSLIVVEWAERVKDVILKYNDRVKIVWIKIDYLEGKHERRLEISLIQNP